MRVLAQTMGHSPPHVVGLILAGGLARRMGAGIDKALLPLAGRPLLAHVLARLTPQVEQVVISANGDLDRLTAFGVPVFADLQNGYQGPLAGVEAAFVGTNADWILSVAVDLPFLPTDLRVKMQAPLQERHNNETMVALSAGRYHYVVALWPRSALPQLTTALANGQLSLHDWFGRHAHRQILFAPPANGVDPFFNINRPADLQTAEALYVRQGIAAADHTDFTLYRGVE